MGYLILYLCLWLCTVCENGYADNLFCCFQATAVVRANLANHILVSHTTSSVAVMVRPPVVAPAQSKTHSYIEVFLVSLSAAVYMH